MRKKMYVVAIAMVVMLFTLVGCGKTESEKNEELNSVIENVDEKVEIEAETDSVVEEVVEEDNTVDMTIEEYVRAVLAKFVHAGGDAFFFAVQDVNNNEYEYSNIYSIQLGEEQYSYEEYENGALNTLNVVDIHNCISMNYDGYYGDINNVNEVTPHMTYNNGDAIGHVQNVGGLSFFNVYWASSEESVYLMMGMEPVDEGVSRNVTFEYDADVDAMVLKSTDDNDIVYFGHGEFTKIDEREYIKFTTELDEGDYVVYAWMDLNGGDYFLSDRTCYGETRTINFVTHH